jgi:N12 class adenine-specific DNA methylase
MVKGGIMFYNKKEGGLTMPFGPNGNYVSRWRRDRERRKNEGFLESNRSMEQAESQFLKNEQLKKEQSSRTKLLNSRDAVENTASKTLDRQNRRENLSQIPQTAFEGQSGLNYNAMMDALGTKPKKQTSGPDPELMKHLGSSNDGYLGSGASKISNDYKKKNPNFTSPSFDGQEFMQGVGEVGQFLKDNNPMNIPAQYDKAKGIIQGVPDAIEGMNNPDIQNPNTWQKAGSNLRAGAGDTVELLGQADDFISRKMKLGKYGSPESQQALANDKGLIKVPDAEQLKKTGQNIREGFDDQEYSKEWSWRSVLDPEWYATDIARSAPTSAVMLAGGIPAGMTGAGIATSLGLTGFKKGLLAGLSGYVGTAPLESAMEAGSIYDEAIQRGMSEEEARKAENEVFMKNMATLGLTNTTEFALAFSPIRIKGLGGTVAGIGGKIGAGIGLEGGQEVAQEKIGADALGDEFDVFSPEAQRVFASGGVMGGGFQFASIVAEKMFSKMPPEVREDMQKAIDEQVQNGVPVEKATEEMLSNVVSTPKGQQLQQEALDETMEDLKREAVAKADPLVEETINKKVFDPRYLDSTFGQSSPQGSRQLNDTQQKEQDIQFQRGEELKGQLKVGDPVRAKGIDGVLYVADDRMNKKVNLVDDQGNKHHIKPSDLVSIDWNEVNQMYEGRKGDPQQQEFNPLNIPTNLQPPFDPSGLSFGQTNPQSRGQKFDPEKSSRVMESMNRWRKNQEQKKQEQSKQEVPPQPTPKKEKAQPSVGDQVRLKGKKEPYDVIGFDNGKVLLRSKQGTNLPPVYPQVIDEVVSPDNKDIKSDNEDIPSQQESINKSAQAEYNEMKLKLASGGQLKSKTKVKRLEDMKKFAEDNGIEFSERYKTLLDKFKAEVEAESKPKQEVVPKEIKPDETKNKHGYPKSVMDIADYNEHELNSLSFAPPETLVDYLKQLGQYATVESPRGTMVQNIKRGIADVKKSGGTLEDHLSSLRGKIDKQESTKDQTTDDLQKGKYEVGDRVEYDTQGSGVRRGTLIERLQDDDYSSKWGDSFRFKDEQGRTNAINSKHLRYQEEAKPLKAIDPSSPLPKVTHKETRTRITATFKPVKYFGHKEDPKQTTLMFPKSKDGKYVMLPKGKSIADINSMLNIEFFQEGVTVKELTDTFNHMNGTKKESIPAPKQEEKKPEPKTKETEETRKELEKEGKTDQAKNVKVKNNLDWLKKAEDNARKRIDSRKDRLLAGLPMDDLVDYAIIGASKIAHKGLDYAQFSKEMLDEFGDSIKLFMRAIHGQSEAMLEMTPDEVNEMIELASKEEKEVIDNGRTESVRTDGAETLEGTQAEDVRGNVSDREVETSSTPSTKRSGAKDGADQEGPSERGTDQQSEDELRAESGSSESDSSDGMGDTQRDHSSTNGRGSTGTRDGNDAVQGNRGVGRNFVITNELDDLGGAKTKFKNNVEALKLLHELEKSGRVATEEEQSILAKYVGWGGLSQALDDRKVNSSNWGSEVKEMLGLIDQGIITKEQYDEMKRSTQYAHYTSKEIIGAMYDAIRQFGFKDGRILEPAVGSGNFFGLLPDWAKGNKTSLVGVERDSLTGRIAKHLYQNANVSIKDFADYKVPDGFFDIAIGNPPFSSNTKRYGQTRLRLHNYFFAKSLDKVREGGIVAFVTSSGSMNSKDKASREIFAEKADFLGAIRLPGDAFKKNAGTEVTTDIIFFQKRKEGKKPKHQGDFINTVPKTIEHMQEGRLKEITLPNNEYFEKNPEMVLGKYKVDALNGGRLSVASDGRDFNEALNEALSNLPKNIYKDTKDKVEEVKREEVGGSLAGVDNGSFAIRNGQIVQRDDNQLISRKDITGIQKERVLGLIDIRDQAKEVMKLQREGASDAQLKEAQNLLNKVYDRFVKKHGHISNETTNRRAFKDDVLGSSLLLALEDVEGEGKDRTVTKNAIFNKRTISAKPDIKNVESAEESLVVSLFQHGRIDFEYMSNLTGKSEEELIKGLEGSIFKNPNGVWETNDAYLSGNVREKLREAEKASKENDDFLINVEALKAVIPEDLTPDEIQTNLGSPWVPASDVQDFITELLEAEDGQVTVTHTPLLGKWDVKPSSQLNSNSKNTDEYGVKADTGSLHAVEIISASLNLKSPRITYKDAVTEKTVVDQDGTAEAEAKQKQIQEAFQEWVWQDPDRTTRLLRKYNDEFNSVVLREYDGELIYGDDNNHKVIPRFNQEKYKLRKWQKNAVWRSVQGGNTLLAHVVGSGKTLEMIVAGMEMKRLGLINKPMYAVPNHLLDQWESEFREAYNDAKILKLSSDTIPSVTTQRSQVFEEVKYERGKWYKDVGEGNKKKWVETTLGPKTVVNLKTKGDSKRYAITDVSGNVIEVATRKKNGDKITLGARKDIKASDIKHIVRDMTDVEYEAKRKENQIERGRVLNRIATTEYDAILITHKTFEKLPVSPELVQEHIRKQISDLEHALLNARENTGENDQDKSVKDLEKAKENLEEKLKENIDEEAKDVAIPFEELGIDQIFVDEAHMFKNLKLHTSLSRVKGLPTQSSKRAEDMFLKTQWLSQTRGGKGVVFATGTPISNTMAEMFIMQKYLGMKDLEDKGLNHFDSWVQLFGRMDTSTEMDATGGYKQVSRFASFDNLQELGTMFRSYADVQMAYDGEGDPPPNTIKIKGRPKNPEFIEVTAEISEDQQRYMETLKARASDLQGGNVDPSDDNWLKITGDGRKMALDVRLVDPSITKDNPDSKVNMAVTNIYEIWRDTTKGMKDKNGDPIENLTQLVFLDLSTPKAESGKDEDAETLAEQGGEDVEEWAGNVYGDIRDKLIQSGVPSDQIAFIHDAKTDAKRKKLFDKVKSGKIRVLLGSTEKMGAGMNVQDKLVALHHLDAPWRPSDVEQREGRMLRQGNFNDNVKFFTYTTKGTFDALMWGILKKKARFINQAITGNGGSRSVEDTGPVEMRFAHVEAASSGDDTIMKKFDADKLVNDLSSLRRSWSKTKAKRQGEIATLPSRIESGKEGIEKFKKDLAVRKDVSGDNFTIQIRDNTFTDRKEAGETLINIYDEESDDLVRGETLKVGSFAGFELHLERSVSNIFFTLIGPSGYKYQTHNITENSDPAGLMQRIYNSVKGIEKEIQLYEAGVTERESRLEDIKKIVDEPFKKQKELDEAFAEQRRLTKKLLEKNDPNKQQEDDGLSDKLDEMPDENSDSFENDLNKEVGDFVKQKNQRGSFHPLLINFDIVKGKKEDKSPFAGDNKEFEERWSGASIQKEKLRDKIKGFLESFKNKATRHREHLPKTAENSKLYYELDLLDKQTGIKSDTAYRFLQAITLKFDHVTFDLFERKVVLDDLKEEADAGRDIAFGLDEESLEVELERINEFVEQSPDVKRAVELRRKIWKRIKNKYIRAMDDVGVDVRQKLLKENYFRHQVIQHANEKIRAGAGKIKTPTNSDYLRKREGSTLDFNRNYLEAESEVMVKMMVDTEKARLIKMVDDRYNIQESLKGRAKKANEMMIDKIIVAEKKSEDAEVDKDGNPISIVEKLLKKFDISQAIAYGELAEMKEDLWDGENGEFADVVKSFKGKKDLEDVHEEATTVSGKKLFRYLVALADKKDEAGVKQARMILKAVSGKREFIKEVLGDKYKTWKKMIPEGYTTWQPRDGNAFYLVDAIPAQLAEQLSSGILEELGLSKEQVNKVMAMGGKYREFVVKEEVSLTLDTAMQKKERGGIREANYRALNLMKQYLLIGPKSIVKYNLRNITGDTDKTLAGNPKGFLQVPKAGAQIYDLFINDNLSPELKEWYYRGGMQSTLQAQETGEINNLKMFVNLHKKKTSITKIPYKMFMGYWKTARLSTDAREALLRYANFLEYVEQMKKNKGKPENYGASVPEHVDALDNIYDKAFKLSNELLIAYDQTSVIGQELREGWSPFWSFTEGNIKTYIQIFKNASRDEDISKAVGRKVLGTVALKSPLIAIRVGSLALKASSLMIALQAWNLLVMGDEEDDLPEDVKRRLHITLGRKSNGDVLYFDRLGTLEDFMEWTGTDNLLYDFQDILNGKKTLKEIATEKPKEIGKKIANMSNMNIKHVVEQVTGRKFFPDPFNPQKIYDRADHLASLFNLDEEYTKLKDKPSAPYDPMKIIIYSADPEQSAYYEIQDKKTEFRKEIGKSVGSFDGDKSARSEALFQFRMGLRHNDKVAMKKYLIDYLANGGTSQGLSRSLKNMDPLFGLNAEEKVKFISQLDDDGKETLAKAMLFYKEDLLGSKYRE